MCVTTGARLSGTTTSVRPLASLNSLTRLLELAACAGARLDAINMRARTRRMGRRLPWVHMGQRIQDAGPAPRGVGAQPKPAGEAAVAERANMLSLLVVRNAKSNDNALMSLAGRP